MEPVFFVMAILGCGETDAPCREVATAASPYTSEAACLAASETELMRRGDLAFPTIVAQCRPAAARAQRLRGNEVRLPDPPAAPPRIRLARAD